MGKRHPASIWGAVGVIVMGALVAGVYDLAYDQTGYLLVAVNDVATMLYLILVSRLCDNKTLGTFGVLFYMNICSLPFMIAYCAVTGEFQAVLDYPQLGDTGFRVTLVLACAQAFFINLSQMWCTQLNSPVTTSVTGQLSKVVTIAAGLVVFTDSNPTTWNNVFGVALGLSGGLYYAKLKMGSTEGQSKPPSDVEALLVGRQQNP